VQFPSPLSLNYETVTDSRVEHRFCCPQFRDTKWNVKKSTILQAAWAIVVGRHTSSEDVVFGTTVSGRKATLDGVKEVAGSTIATVPVRVNICRGQKVSAYLQRIQDQASEKIPYEQIGLQAIAKISNDARNACGFQTLVVIQPVGNDLCTDSELGEWRTGLKGDTTHAYALTLNCFLEQECIKMVASFDSRVLEPWIMQRILEQLSFVIQQLATARPAQTIADIDILTLIDREGLWVRNGTMPTAVERCVHKLIEERAREQPKALAVCA
jgi:hypothetical protein